MRISDWSSDVCSSDLDLAAEGILITPLAGGFLAQSRDSGRIDPGALKVVTKRAPSEQELADMVFAFRVAKHVKSNAIVYARDGATVGIGAGPTCRVDCAPNQSGRASGWHRV